MSAVDIIASHQYKPDGQLLGTRCTHIECDWFVPASTPFTDMLTSYGEHVEAALSSAGHVIVELPEVARSARYDAEVSIEGPGLDGAHELTDDPRTTSERRKAGA
ncbi:hypothetical protein [Prescottella equi]|uniref:hypothetical protein n=1 Tax=Rhodococcus hoagii TaxID=43767 RepID=UPI000D0EDA15|nr:hypothetical protein [Prescottella equi]AVP71271.1 hypothetical protein C7H75_24630 [Prescottella equi]